ncbi:hypothetical protein V1514DRAFT_323598 [Lipomyces japonicus]|uniref:uncharacterized protein n=1 Tax=Lipomyces japonicus TaxID=56871 RepID=UPI0034CE5420
MLFQRQYVESTFNLKTPDEVFGTITVLTPNATEKQVRNLGDQARKIADFYQLANRFDDIEIHQKWIDVSQGLVNQISIALRPLPFKWIWAQDEYVETKSRWRIQQEFASAAGQLLIALSELLELLSLLLSPSQFEQSLNWLQIIEALATYTSVTDPWSNSKSAEISNRLIDKYSSVLIIEIDQVANNILKNTLRPIFQSARHKKVTPAGRRVVADYDSPGYRRDHVDINADADHNMPWMVERPEAESLLHFVLTHARGKFTETNWSLLVPSVLVIMDDPDPVYKTMGVSSLWLLISKTRPEFVNLTGVAPVFWDTLITCLAFLPLGSSNITTGQSVKLLQASFDCLILLSGIMAHDSGAKSISNKIASSTLTWDDTLNTTQGNQQHHPARVEFKRKRADLLAEVIADGVCHGMQICGDKVELATVLITQAGKVAQADGIFFVRHLQQVLKLIVNVLSDPFGMEYLPLTLAGLNSLNAIMTNTEPRIANYKYLITKGLILSWKKLLEKESSITIGDNSALAQVRQNILSSTGQLKDIVYKFEGHEDWDEMIEQSTKLDPSLKVLFNKK